MTGSVRMERDTFGEIAVPADRLWGAQTQRSLQNFRISTEKQSPELIRALATVKRAAATVNAGLGQLAADKAKAIELSRVANRALDKAVSKGVIHANQAANRKSAISLTVNALD